MAQRLSSEERARIEVMIAAGVSVAEMAWRLGRDPSTIHREIKRNSTPAGYDADLAEVAAQSRVMRPKPARLVSEPALAASVAELLDTGWSPHAISAGLRSEGLVVCAETIYRACYDHTGSRGLPEGSWRCLPRRRRRRKQRGRCTRKPSPLGVFKPIADRPAAASGRSEAGHWEGDLIIGKGNRSAVVTLTERVSRQTLLAELPHGHDAQSTAAAVVAALRPPARASGQNPGLGPGPRDGPLGRRGSRPRHEGVLLRAAVSVAAPDQRADQRAAAPVAAQRHRHQRRPSASRCDRGLAQHDAPQAPRLGVITQRLHCPHLRSPIELAHQHLASRRVS